MEQRALSREEIILFIDKLESEAINLIGRYSKVEIIKQALLLYSCEHVSVTGPVVVDPEMSDEEYARFQVTKYDWFIPHYLICLTLLSKDVCDKKLNEADLKEILWRCRTNALLIFYLNNRKTYELLSIDNQTYRIMYGSLEKTEWRYSNFYSQLCRRAQNIEPINLDDQIKEYYDVFQEIRQEYFNRQGFLPESVFGALFCIGYIMYNQAEELGLTQPVYLKQNPVIIFPKNKFDSYFGEVHHDQRKATFRNVILSNELVLSYLDSIKTKKKKVEREIFSLPLWDYPLIEAEGMILTALPLLVDAIPELAERIKQKDRISQSKINGIRHRKIIEAVKEILVKKGYEVELNTPVSNGLSNGEIDILAIKNDQCIHIECKARSVSWKNRMFIQEDDELDSLYHKFLADDRIDGDHWNTKCGLVEFYLKNKYGDRQFYLSNIVVTKNPMPLPNKHKVPEVVWLNDFDGWLENVKNQR